MSFNRVILQGRLTRDPESRQAGQHTAVKFGIATSQKYKAKTGELKEITTFVDCESWGVQGETVMRLLKKGSPVLLEGRLKSESWTDTATGAKRSKLIVTADAVECLDEQRSQGEISGYDFDSDPF